MTAIDDDRATGPDGPTVPERVAEIACPVTGTILDPAVQDDPWDFYAALREDCPVFPIPEIGAVMVTRYEDVRYVLLHPELFSNSGRGGGTRQGLQVDKAIRYHQILRERGWGHVETLQRTDPPVHTHYRRLVNKAFIPKAVRRLADHIDEVTTELLDTCLPAPGTTGEVEFVDDFSMPLPGIVIAEQLGLDKSQIETFKRWADAMLALAMRPVADDEIAEIAEIELEAQHHLAEVFEARRAEPTDDLMSALVHAHEGEVGDGPDGEGATPMEPLTMNELQNLMHQLVTGGFETTTNALNHGMWLLCRRPDVQEQVRADPSLVPTFVEEVLRFEGPVQGLPRRATRDVELGGVTIPKDAMVIVRYAAANRDPSVFPDPDEFRLDRDNLGGHLAFGAGPHYCVGSALARQELVSGFTAWLERTTDIELARPFDGPVHEPSLLLFPIPSLPLRVTT